MARPPRPAQLAMREGVSPSTVAVPAGPWPQVLDFLAERLPAVSREGWHSRLAQGLVLDDEGQAVRADAPCRPGMRLHYYRWLEDEAALPPPFDQAQIVFEDEALLVADKPHFMPVTPTGRFVQQSLLVQLKRRTGCETLSPVHRIDRETAGLVVLCKRPGDRDAYQGLFRERTVHKRYLAVAPDPGTPLPLRHESRLEEDALFFRMREVPGPANSLTHLQLLQSHAGRGLYQLAPDTGKRHQLRVHMMGLGRPIEGDQFYPVVRQGPGAPPALDQPLQLLAWQVGFKDPVTGAERAFESALRLNW